MSSYSLPLLFSFLAAVQLSMPKSPQSAGAQASAQNGRAVYFSSAWRIRNQDADPYGKVYRVCNGGAPALI
ncbi:hypothetical protein [Paludibaculum fermentans]|uniref:Uncharacterized protein n=1 Tax=Paludibaculum fermentans TaxID=1473598 RepID=A0A7S7SML8_PALFE|nr:hypothetical protein [Paludibaculum fermentans]QOY89185.1 hypothetical protein IRI77_04285 [Paludibaculum fermentans]